MSNRPSAAEIQSARPSQLTPPVRPRWRGAIPLAAFFATLPFIVWLRMVAPSRVAPIAWLYGGGLLALFGVSAIYHRRDWSPQRYVWIRKIDHATIFVFIAASYTPIALLGVGGARGMWLTRVTWLAAIAGSLQAVIWPTAPRGVRAAFYLAMGWTGVFAIAPLARHLGWWPPSMLIAGGLTYTLGALIYAKRWPDPAPSSFGYHELFHSFVVVACAMLFVCIHACLTAA